MKPVTVIVPTANRPEYLRMALASIAAQTGVGDIEEVIVSENLGNRESGNVCGEFGKLPVRYILQDPPLSPLKHGLFLYKEPKTEYTAILHDDDWWLPGHLQRALTLLKERPQAASFFGASIETESVMYDNCRYSAKPYLWIASGKPAHNLPYTLKAKDVMSIAWITTPFMYSSMVVKSKVLVQALSVWESKVISSSDRLLYASVSRFGDIVYDPFPGIVYRWHPKQTDSNTSKSAYLSDLFEASDIIYRLAVSMGYDPAREWNNYIKDMPVEYLESFYYWIRLYKTYPNKKEFGLDKIISSINNKTRNRRLRNKIVKCVPPVLFLIKKWLAGLFSDRMW